MSKVKRILSVIMAMVMVLAMSVPTFAAGENATITLKRFDKANKVEYMQIIQKDETKTSGWAFTNGAPPLLSFHCTYNTYNIKI